MTSSRGRLYPDALNPEKSDFPGDNAINRSTAELFRDQVFGSLVTLGKLCQLNGTHRQASRAVA